MRVVRRRSTFVLVAALGLIAALSFATARSGAQPAPPAAEPGAHQAGATPAGEPAAAPEGEHGGGDGLWALVARLLNFGVLVGTLVYFLKRPFATYLKNRSAQIRRDLVEAEALREHAAAQLAEIEAKLKVLPREIEALRSQGAEEIAAEEARLRRAAEAERDRLVEHARREIARQVRVATQELRREAAELAVAVARERIAKSLTTDAHARLVDRCASEIKEIRILHD